MVIPMFWIGLYPETVLRCIRPSVQEVIRQVEVRSALSAKQPLAPATAIASAIAAEAQP
jgi:NADH:ubiquinone oxidoreductase subunit 4 (subunit M)